MAVNCNCSIPYVANSDKFTGCDGKKWSDKFLKYHLNKAIEEENYELASECRDEINRRKIKN
ncbi:MAG: UvrB/UvrC motif-containing protein [Gelidibacter sp.]|nr:UvrB/UvrC motif-containing protein [Gelidibacter sp.]